MAKPWLALKVKRALDADEVQVAPIEGGHRFEVTRGECRAKFDVYDDHVNWVSLTSPGGQGWVKDAHAMARELFIEKSKYLTASAGSDEAEEILKAHGDWKGNGKLRWDLA